jgi:hypothetical protein
VKPGAECGLDDFGVIFYYLLCDNMGYNLPMLKKSPEEKLVIGVLSASLFEGFGAPGKILRQERPRCCGTEINLYHSRVTYRVILVRGQSFTLLEPFCPICGRKVQASYNIVN